MSSIKSAKDCPMEFIHNVDKDERFLKHYDKTRKIWHKQAVKLARQTEMKSPEDTVMRSSDTFSELKILKTGKLFNNANTLHPRRMSQHEFDVCTRPRELEIFEDHNLKHPCLRHIRRSPQEVKSMKVIVDS